MKKQKKSGVKSAKGRREMPEVAASSKAGSKIAPLGDRVLVRPITEEVEAKNNFGIIIPDTAEKEKPEQGVVVAVGEGKFENGVFVPMTVKPGDKVIFSKYGFDEVKLADEELYILKEENILAIIKK